MIASSKRAMKTETQSRQPQTQWPFDLRVFAILAGLWAICLVIRAFVHPGEIAVVDPVQTVFGGVRFDGDAARIVLIVEAGIFATIAIGILAQRRWGLLLALCFMAEVVMSHLAFVIAYLPLRSEWMSVRATAMQGPTMVLITLYLWIRASDLIFDAPASSAHARRESSPQHREAVSADSGAGDVGAVVGYEK
jgi:hypothetical protein